MDEILERFYVGHARKSLMFRVLVSRHQRWLKELRSAYGLRVKGVIPYEVESLYLKLFEVFAVEGFGDEFRTYVKGTPITQTQTSQDDLLSNG